MAAGPGGRPWSRPWVSGACALAVVAPVLALAAPAAGQVVHYERSATGEVAVRTGIVYDAASGRTLDLYLPPAAGGSRATGAPAPSAPAGSGLPAVVFVLTVPDGTMDAPMKDYPQYTSWARLVAADGMVGVVYEVGDPDGDLDRVLGHLAGNGDALGIDADRIALWSCSGNVPVALRAARRGAPAPAALRALVAYYGFMPTPDGFRQATMDSIGGQYGMPMPGHAPGEAYPPGLPMLIARAGQDRWTAGLESLDHFVGYALGRNLPVTVVNYPDGRHAFDVLDDTPETRRIVGRTLAFLRHHLKARGGGHVP